LSRSARDRKEEILGLLLVTIGLLTVLSLLPQILVRQLTSVPDTAYGNLAGLVGKFINESLKDLLGVLAYALPVLLAVWGWRIFKGRAASIYSRITVFTLVVCAGVDLLLALSRTGKAEGPLDFSAGVLGNWLSRMMVTGLGHLGALLVTAAALLIFLILYTGLSVRSLLDGLTKAVLAVSEAFGWVAGKVTPVLKKARQGKKRPAKEKKKAFEIPDKELAGREVEKRDSGVEEDTPPDDFDFSLGPVPEHGEGKEPAGEVGLQSNGESARISEEIARPGDLSAGYELPPIDILQSGEDQKVVSDEELTKMGRVLMAKLADFSVEGELINFTRGPQVSTFEIRPAPGVKIGRIAALADDLAMAMHAKRIRILAPIPGKGAVGVELPNPVLEMVRAREIFESQTFRSSQFLMPIGLGKDLEGRIRVADLTRMPHLLIAGTTGSGKSVCMNMIIASLLFHFGPEKVRLLMIDPKMIELNLYNDIPHLLHPVVTDAKETAAILKWVAGEMDRRYRLLSRNSVRSIEDYNYKLNSGRPVRTLFDDPDEVAQRMPYVVILVDELSDLMCSDVKNEIEAALVRLAQMARAVGIHLVVATQRPSVDVITGLIKANFPSRLSFQVYSKIDSRTILDVSGADQLLRNGDMLFVPTGQADPIRIQGAYLSSEEAERLAEHWRNQPLADQEEETGQEGGLRPQRKSSILKELERRSGVGEDGEERDELFSEAARLVVRHDQGSTSLIQRRLKVGYARAGRIVDQLEQAGILGPPDGSKAREVLVSDEDLADYGVE